MGPLDVVFLLRATEIHSIALLSREEKQKRLFQVSSASFEDKQEARAEPAECKDWDDLILESIHIAFMQSEALRFEAASQSEINANMELGF